MLLKANGYKVSEGVVYYIASKERVRVPIDEALEQKVMDAINGLRSVAAQPAPPRHSKTAPNVTAAPW